LRQTRNAENAEKNETAEKSLAAKQGAMVLNLRLFSKKFSVMLVSLVIRHAQKPARE